MSSCSSACVYACVGGSPHSTALIPLSLALSTGASVPVREQQNSRAPSRGGAQAMDHFLYQHAHVEPISFGIDQILSGDQSCGSGFGSRMPEPDYGLPAYGSGGGCGFAGTGSCGGGYVNTGMNGQNVIRVPAHRPGSAGSGTVTGSVGSLSAITFPWMESNRRCTRDRFTGQNRTSER